MIQSDTLGGSTQRLIKPLGELASRSHGGALTYVHNATVGLPPLETLYKVAHGHRQPACRNTSRHLCLGKGFQGAGDSLARVPWCRPSD